MSVFLFNTQEYFFRGHSFFRFWSFIQNKTSSYFEKETEWETIFCIFLEIENTFFCFDKSQIFEMTSENLLPQKQENIFSKRKNFFLENHNTCVSALLTCKKNIRTRGVTSRVLNSGNFAEGMTLPKAVFLSSLHAWFRLHID